MTFQGTIAAINTALNGLTFSPTADFNGACQPAGRDQRPGQHRSGGAKTDTDSVAITVNAGQRRPAGTDGHVTDLEDGSHTFAAADFGFTDPNDSPANAFASVMITSLPAAGSLTYQSNPVLAGDEIAVGEPR